MQPAAPAPCRAGGYGPPGLEKNEALTARVLSFLGWESALFGCAGARRAGGCGPGNGKIAANEKRGRRRGPVPQWDMRGLAAAACRPPNPRKTDPQQPALLVFGDGKAPCLAAPVPCRAGSYEPGNDKNGRKRKARAQEGPCPTAGCARLGRGSLPPKQLPVKAADFSFTAGNLAEALNPFFIFDKIQEGKSKHRPLSCKHN